MSVIANSEREESRAAYLLTSSSPPVTFADNLNHFQQTSFSKSLVFQSKLGPAEHPG